MHQVGTVTPGEAREWLAGTLDRGEDLTLPTTGSTGVPKQVVLSARAITASASTSNAYLGAGHWVLALPLDHVAGWMVVARAVVAGTLLSGCDRPFTPDAFLDAHRELPPGEPWLTALVPTQLQRVLADREARRVLATSTAVIVGGSSCPAPLIADAAVAGVRFHRTYGMTETCGGCVYDGRPLPGVRVRVGDTELAPGVTTDTGDIAISGPMLASCYGDPQLTGERFVTDSAGARWHLTRDAGRIVDGTLHVLGRTDDMMISGGVNVHPGQTEDVIRSVRGVAAAAVVGLPDEHWGERVCALVELEAGSDVDAVLSDVSNACVEQLAPSARPKSISVGQVPLNRLGKIDRPAARRVLGA